MTVGELIKELEKFDKDLEVMAAGENAEKVIVEECHGNRYVRIFEPIDVEFYNKDVIAMFGDWRKSAKPIAIVDEVVDEPVDE